VASTLCAQAQAPAAASETLSLRQVFDAAWSRQPEALALPSRRDAARAGQQAAQSWTPEPVSLDLANKTDQLNDNRGANELAVGLVVPIWLPGERSSSTELANAESAALESRASAAQLAVAASVREAWWQWQRARMDVDTTRDQLDTTRRIAADVAKRAKSGDLARADQHQADGAVAAAESALAHAEGVLATAQQHLRAMAGVPVASAGSAGAVSEPEPAPGTAAADTHAALQALKDRATVAERSAALASSRSRANPELLLATTRERANNGESYQQTITLGVRIPFGAGPRHDARTAGTRAEAIEIMAQLALERERLDAEREAARVRVEATRLQLAAAERRVRLAVESRGFFDKSFRLGETDLPTRLRIEAEAAEAERQSARSQIELAAAISSWRQALGLLPQ
jgi:cobalt-zinc-cadmium efflux system outer membrane protein